MINALGSLALLVLLVASLAFVVPYVITVPDWFREEHRAHVVAFSIVILQFAILYVLRALIAPNVFQVIRLITLWELAAVVVWRAMIFWRGMLRRRRKARELTAEKEERT